VKKDKAPYDLWAKRGYIKLTPGFTVDYKYVVEDILEELEGLDVRTICFDRWRIDAFKKELEALDAELPLIAFGQGFKDMSPAIESFETALMKSAIMHGNNPVLTSCAANVRVERNDTNDRKFTKTKSTGRIDGMVSSVMAIGAMEGKDVESTKHSQVIVSLSDG
jgi:phage terminase large subunit-like protein